MSIKNNSTECQCLYYLIHPSIQGVNTLFVVAFNTVDSRIEHSRYYLPTAKVEDCNVMIFGKNVFDQPVKKLFYIFTKNCKSILNLFQFDIISV